MKPLIVFYGTIDSSRPAKIIEANGKKFVSFTLVSRNEGSQYPDYVQCALYTKDTQAAVDRLRPGLLVHITGEASARAYISTKDNKPRGTLNAFVKSYEIMNGPSAQSPSSASYSPPAQSNPAPSAPQKAAFESDGGADDVPF